MKMFGCKHKSVSMRDERLEKKVNALTAQLLPMMLVLQAAVLIVKLALGGWRYCLLDVVGLAVGAVFAAVMLTVRGVWRARDEALQEIRESALSKAFFCMFAVLVVGEFVCMMIDPEGILWYAPTLLVWGLPALIFTVKLLCAGGLQWGGVKAEKDGKAALKRSTCMGAVFFGVVMGADKCFVDGAFEPSGLLYVLGMGAAWGILFYLMFSLLLKIGGKQADRALEQAESEAEDDEA